MVAYLRTYKVYILAGLLGAYLAGTFEVLFMEGLHHISHLAEEFRTEMQHSYYNHVHEDGDTHTHRHIVLEKIDDALEDSSNPENFPTEDPSNHLKKKNPEQRSTFDPIAHSFSLFPEKPLHTTRTHSIFFTQVPTPPPRPWGQLM